MKVVFTHGYYIADDPREQRIMKPYPPLGMLYVSAWLEQNGFPNQVFDSTFSTRSQQLHFLKTELADVVALYTNLMTKIEIVRLIKTLKNGEYGQPVVVLGGPDVTYNIENYLEAGADYLIIGEGEETMHELVQALKNETDPMAVNGLAFKRKGQVIQTDARIKMKELDQLPLPNRGAIDMKLYLETWKRNHGQSSMTISTQRGCPYTCKWCSTAVYGQSYRRRPAEQVVDEMKMLRDTWQPDAIWFVDDVFTVSHKWLSQFAEELQKQEVLIPFECITRAERLNDDVLSLLKQSGCFRIWIGAESGSQAVIDAMDRRVDVNLVREMIQKTNAIGIESGTFIMLGYPGETETDILQTIRYLKQAAPTEYTITLAYPIKGTSLYQEVENRITVKPDWQTSTDRDIDFERTYPRRYYRFALSKVINEVEWHRSRTSPKKPFLKRMRLKGKSIAAGWMMKLSK